MQERKVKLCREALQDYMAGEDKAIQRRNWDVLGIAREVFTQPQKYFTSIRILSKNIDQRRLRVSA